MDTTNIENKINILIIGKSGVGKSLLAQKIKNYIFKSDPNSKISIVDVFPYTTTGNGTNEYIITINKEVKQESLDSADVVIEVKTDKLVNRIKEL